MQQKPNDTDADMEHASRMREIAYETCETQVREFRDTHERRIDEIWAAADDLVDSHEDEDERHLRQLEFNRKCDAAYQCCQRKIDEAHAKQNLKLWGADEANGLSDEINEDVDRVVLASDGVNSSNVNDDDDDYVVDNSNDDDGG